MLLINSRGACPIGLEIWVFFEHEQLFSEFAKLFLNERQLSAFTSKRYKNWRLEQKPGVTFSKKICDIQKKGSEEIFEGYIYLELSK